MDADFRYAAARQLLRDLNDVDALCKNPLLALHAGESHDRLRARVLRAVESLDPGHVVKGISDRRYRLYQILVRCDLDGESHKRVAGALGISRSQFYVDRREAFLLLADSVEGTPVKTHVDGPLPDALSLHLDYVEMLRKQGRFEAAWRESLRVVGDLRGQSREIEIWSIVADAARFLGNIRHSLDAVNQMSRIAETSAQQEFRCSSSMRIAISEIALQGVLGKFDAALERFDREIETSGNERTMNTRDVTLFAILLGLGAEVCIESGHWQRAQTLIRRAEAIIDRSEVPFANARLQRLRSRIARELNGDSARAELELSGSLRLLQQHKQLPEMAMDAVEYGIVLADIDRREAMKYIDYGLVMAKDACGYDQCAVLFANAAPFFLERTGPDETLREIAEIRMRAPLSARANFLVDIAEADARLARGEFDVASEAAINVGQSLEDAALFPASAKARLIAIEAFGRGGKTAKGKQLLKKSNEFLRTYAAYATRQRARRSGLLLDSFAQ